jgi:hypothetical protein
MQPIAANEIDLSHHDPIMAGYGPKNIYAQAVLVTLDNIGKLALDFELDLRYLGGKPCFRFLAKRELDDPIELMVFPGYWIIMLWDEIHIFRDDLFRKTFEIESKDPEMVTLNDELKKTDWSSGPVLKSQLVEKARAAGDWSIIDPETMAFLAKDAPSLFTEEEQEELGKKGVVFGPQAWPGPDATQIMPATGSVEPKKFERFVEKATGKPVQFREGVYEQLSDCAKTAFRPADKASMDERPQGATKELKPDSE